MAQRFPFLDHFTIRDSDMVEAWRAQWSDQSILHAALHPFDMRRKDSPVWRQISLSGLSPDQLGIYFGRNPRPRCEVA